MPRFIKMWLFSALLSLTAIGMWKAIEWYYAPAVEDTTPIVITAEDLALSYEGDLSLSNSLYTGKTVIMTGVVSAKGSAGTYYTVVLVGNVYQIDLSFYDITEIAELNSVNEGDTITIIGKVTGLNLVYVSVTDCTLE